MKTKRSLLRNSVVENNNEKTAVYSQNGSITDIMATDDGKFQYSKDGGQSFEEASSGSLKYKTFDVNETYKQFEVVNYYDRIIISKIDNNVGNYPTLQPSDPNWLFLSFFSEQLPIKAITNQLYILGSSTASTSENEAVYKEGNCYILDGKVYDKDGVLANNQDVENKANLSGGNTFSGNQTVDGNIILKNDVSLQSENSDGGVEDLIKMTTNNVVQLGYPNRNTIYRGNLFGPANDNARDLGDSSRRWKDVYVAGNLSDGTNSVAVADIATKNDVPSGLIVFKKIYNGSTFRSGAFDIPSSEINVNKKYLIKYNAYFHGSYGRDFNLTFDAIVDFNTKEVLFEQRTNVDVSYLGTKNNYNPQLFRYNTNSEYSTNVKFVNNISTYIIDAKSTFDSFTLEFSKSINSSVKYEEKTSYSFNPSKMKLALFEIM